LESVGPVEGRPRITPAATSLISEVAARVAELARTIRELERLVEAPGSADAGGEAGPGPAEARDEPGEFELFARESNLTGREAEVLRHLLEGHSNRRISRSLHISESTVKNHLHAIFVKLDTRDRTQLIAKVYRFMAEHSVRGGAPERARVPMQGPAAQVRPIDDASA